jgi:pimeloyl-ACP methyl ester carboxylesterase
MAAVTSAYAEFHGYSSVVLIGYSGGGVMATLVAAHLKELKGLITVAANLDIDAWADYHGYEPLSGSLNPAGIENFDIPARQLHLYGARDKVVAPVTADRFFVRNPDATREIIPDFDHVCCWTEGWAAILERALENLESSH